MKRLGRLIVMSEAEYYSDLRRSSDDEGKIYLAGFNAGKFHSAGGYSHTLPKLKEELRQLREQVARYQPIADIFQPSDALVTLIQEFNGVSDADAAADFEIVGQQMRRERAKK